ncbi:hypothetical protein GR158_06435 [Shinella sp. AETb1-6]|uniref:hypothetical protein n=1 Tax=Shinella sp. AETb1-6 TaxID=2692210 RepID=UPI001371E933|nr:hypothetical protein [Shinella sp. AETb1-6]MXN50747.1 hypothetical protein [Shinella sp. AETb1-6]
MFNQAPRRAIALTVMLMAGSAGASDADLTIEVGGALFEHGGVVTIYPIPVPSKELSVQEGKAAGRVTVTSRYAEVQLKYPKDGKYVFRFRNTEGAADDQKLGTQALSVIGTDMEDRGPQMTVGFKDAYSSGGQVIRVLPRAEHAGESDAARTNARWGKLEGKDALPPADERGARSLAAILRYGVSDFTFHCAGNTSVQVCTIPQNQWPTLDMRWWRDIAEARLERLDYHALRRCYDSSWLGGGTCEPDPKSDEPAYFRK